MASYTLFPLPLGAFIMVLVPYLSVPNSKRSWYLAMWHVALGSQMPGTDNGIFLWWNLINISSRTDNSTQSQGVLLGDVLSAMSCVLTAVSGWNCRFGLKQAGAETGAFLSDSTHRLLTPVGIIMEVSTSHLCRATALHGHRVSFPCLHFCSWCHFATPS